MRSSRKKPRDLNKLAASIVADATDGRSTEETLLAEGKNPAAVALGKLGGLKGGAARAAALSTERRKEIAEKAARARWKTRDAKTKED
jgi:hypothetical protein